MKFLVFCVVAKFLCGSQMNTISDIWHSIIYILSKKNGFWRLPRATSTGHYPLYPAIRLSQQRPIVVPA
jgi:hypothetical protein